MINLLLVGGGEKWHYWLLGDLTNQKAAAYYCYRYQHQFSREDLLKKYCEYSPQHVTEVIKCF